MRQTILDNQKPPISLEGAPPFEATMITAEKYRQSMCDELEVLNIKTAFLLTKENPKMSKECAEYSKKFIDERLIFLKEQEKQNYVQLRELLDLISKAEKDLQKINVKPGLKVLESIMRSVKEDSNVAKANYFKIFKQY